MIARQFEAAGFGRDTVRRHLNAGRSRPRRPVRARRGNRAGGDGRAALMGDRRRRRGGLAEPGAKSGVRDDPSDGGEPERDRVVDEHGGGCVGDR
jgi:hypothetical protein